MGKWRWKGLDFLAGLLGGKGWGKGWGWRVGMRMGGVMPGSMACPRSLRRDLVWNIRGRRSGELGGIRSGISRKRCVRRKLGAAGCAWSRYSNTCKLCIPFFLGIFKNLSSGFF